MNPRDPVDMCRAMRRIAEDPETRERLRQRGQARSLGFRALPVVEDLVRAYARAAVASRTPAMSLQDQSHGDIA
jgi:hypothetical protein